MDIPSDWCLWWGTKANIKKSQVIHHQNPQRTWHSVPLKLLNMDMEYVSDYKYLGCWVNEFSRTEKMVSALTTGASRFYGRIVGLFMRYRTFCTLYHSYIESIANYASAVWGFRDYSPPWVLQNKIARFYWGMHRLAPVSANGIEMGIMNIRHAWWLEMV